MVCAAAMLVRRIDASLVLQQLQKCMCISITAPLPESEAVLSVAPPSAPFQNVLPSWLVSMLLQATEMKEPHHNPLSVQPPFGFTPREARSQTLLFIDVKSISQSQFISFLQHQVYMEREAEEASSVSCSNG